MRPLEDIVAAGLAAPSMHNTQPWAFIEHAGGTLDMYAATDRLLPIGDPNGRALYLATGAALYNMRLAARRWNLEPVMRPLPDPGDTSVLARLTVSEPGAPSYAESVQYGAIRRRHTNRHPFRMRPIPSRVEAELIEAAAREGAELRRLSPLESHAVLSVTRKADRAIAADRLYVDEMTLWTGRRVTRRDGVPIAAFGRTPSANGSEPLPMRDFGIALPGRWAFPARFEAEPALFVLSSPGDDPVAWMRAGEALQHVLLIATICMLSTSFFYQALQIDEFRAQLRRAAHTAAYPQMIMRIGYGPRVPATPRRPVADVLSRG